MSVTEEDRERARAVMVQAPTLRNADAIAQVIAQALADERERALEGCAAWMETLASPTLHNDPFIRAADWAAKLVRQYGTKDQP